MAPLVGSRLDIGTSAVKNSSADGDSAVLEARNQTGKRAGRKEKEDTEENIWSGEESSGDDEDEEEDDSEEEGESEVEMDDEGGVQDEENEAAEVGGEDGEGKGAEASPEKGGEREKEKKRKGKGKGKVMKTEKVVEDCKPTDHHGAKRTVREDEGSRRRKRTKPLDAVQELMMVRFKADEEKGKDRLVRTTVKAEGDQELEKLKHQTELQKQKTAQLDIDRLKLQLQLAQLQPQL
ncbi:hypothetical protein CF327_g6883 [Tilletia walkeri]|nr:hypothetical protein CF327_g6883 [Tilletia walkeri]